MGPFYDVVSSVFLGWTRENITPITSALIIDETVGRSLPRVRTRCPWLRRWGMSDHWADSLHADPDGHFSPHSLDLLLCNQEGWMLSHKGHACTTYIPEGYRHRQEHRLRASNEESFHMITSSFPSVTSVCAWFSLTFNVKKAKLSWEAE